METLYIIIAIAIAVALLFYFFLIRSSDAKLGNLREFAPDGFRDYDGDTRSEVYIGCKGYVFDVTKSSNYKPGGHYHVFAGRDATVALAKMSLDPADLETNDTSALKENEITSLDMWFKQFKEHYKYPIVGKIMNSSKKSH
eukprot:TRINITY_DN13024_c0_g1_i7.p2 TRINITY_DN13024_c0_g1~~TRINITY_DN13024_c0_g1_i7.p2  ORF type:complete len:141 (+),score=48.28 TRINITY_DN13024_c0_g1_i7:68-490(+)